MEKRNNNWLDDLIALFSRETSLYETLQKLEEQKTQAIRVADGKNLESIAKQSYQCLVEASEIERVRMKFIQQVYEEKNMDYSNPPPTLNDFLTILDRNSNYRMKKAGTELKEAVKELKQKILLNEKLLNSRKELLQSTIAAMKEAAPEDGYYTPEKAQTPNKKRASMMVNTAV